MFSFRYNENSEERIIDSFHVMLIDEGGICMLKILDEPDVYYELDFEEYTRIKKVLLGAKHECA